MLAGLTAAMLALRWQPPRDLTTSQWITTRLEIMNMRVSVAKMHGTNENSSPPGTWAVYLEVKI